MVRDYGGCDKVCFVERRGVDIAIASSQSRYALSHVNGGDSKLIIVGTYLPDRMNHPDRGSRIDCIRRLLADLRELAETECCDNLVIIGDMNADPFDSELFQADSFNAALFKPIIDKSPSRIVGGVERPFLYSPMLSCFEERGKACGSYYYSDDFRSQYWHCFDQVIVSRPLVRNVKPEYLQFAGGSSLMSDMRPNTKISDRLPLLVSISKEIVLGENASLWTIPSVDEPLDSTNRVVELMREQCCYLEAATNGAVRAKFDKVADISQWTASVSAIVAASSRIAGETSGINGLKDASSLYRKDTYGLNIFNCEYRFRILEPTLTPLYPVTIWFDDGVLEDTEMRNNCHSGRKRSPWTIPDIKRRSAYGVLSGGCRRKEGPVQHQADAQRRKRCRDAGELMASMQQGRG